MYQSRFAATRTLVQFTADWGVQGLVDVDNYLYLFAGGLLAGVCLPVYPSEESFVAAGNVFHLLAKSHLAMEGSAC